MQHINHWKSDQIIQANAKERLAEEVIRKAKEDAERRRMEAGQEDAHNAMIAACIS